MAYTANTSSFISAVLWSILLFSRANAQVDDSIGQEGGAVLGFFIAFIVLGVPAFICFSVSVWAIYTTMQHNKKKKENANVNAPIVFAPQPGGQAFQPLPNQPSQLQLVPGPIVYQNDAANRQTDQVMNARPHPLPTNVPAATHSVNQVHIPQHLQEQTFDNTYEEVPEVYY